MISNSLYIFANKLHDSDLFRNEINRLVSRGFRSVFRSISPDRNTVTIAFDNNMTTGIRVIANNNSVIVTRH